MSRRLAYQCRRIGGPGSAGGLRKRILRETVSRSNVRAMTTFVLVHGAWGGSYGFKYVRGPLREAGHEVFTPSLTGVGERVHLASPQVDLTTHVTDVVNTILYEDLSDIVLLG